ncbi:dTDP-4-dehydrorhamnose 3,5-epimerase family protein [Streptomyces beigongshangae]|uniref:dTDP-4-dehydrorhamnose 3,5-epimerase family protein n=1 Tax=Streptomyces beigongshangae TaxID=2841597 RepID=UPI001C861311|nr:dTDP-4-dehydrorhamnose 3,5-epimerase family protein [Streptomyces sp. REN17]
MRIRRLAVEGAFEFTPEVHSDRRGLFVSPLQEEPFLSVVGRPFRVAQTNHSRSAKGVLRGLHFTTAPPGQAKYVHCARGSALDVVVDIRLGSPTFGAWDAIAMDSGTFRAAYFPEGVGHAFLALEEDTVMSYLVSTPYRAELELAVDPLDPRLALPWPDDLEFIVSDRDLSAPSLAEAQAKGLLPRYEDCGRRE